MLPVKNHNKEQSHSKQEVIICNFFHESQYLFVEVVKGF